MTRTKKFFYNSLSTAIYQLVVMLVGFVTPRVLLQFYGSETNGLVSSINQFITYFNLVEAGIAGAAVYSLYKPLAESNYKKINGIVSAAKKFYIQSGWIFTALVVALAIIYPLFIKMDTLSAPMIGILVLVLGAKGFLEFFTLAKYRVILTADQKTYMVSISSTVYVVLQMIIIVVLAYFRMNIVIIYTVSILALFTRTIILMIYVKKKYKYINYNEKPDKKALNKRWDALFLQILQSVQTGAPVILATVFTSLKNVSVFSVFNMVFVGINGVLSIFVNGLSASFGDLIVSEKKERFQKAYSDFEYTYYLIISIVYSASFVLIMPFINIYTNNISDANYNQPLIGFLFVLNGLLYNLKTPQGTLVISAGMYKETRYRNLAQALIIIIGGCILAPSFGIVGILIASCLSNLYRLIDLSIFIPRRVTEMPIRNTYKRFLMVFIIVIASVAPFIFVHIQATNYLSWITNAILVTLYAGIITIIIGNLFDRKVFKSIIDRIKYMVVKKNNGVV